MTLTTFENLRILVTGACGTIGQALVRRLLGLDRPPAAVVGLDHDESALFFLDQDYAGDARASFFLADVRDRDSCARHMDGIDVVFHTAALKHVALGERSPEEVKRTNIDGVDNLVVAAGAHGVGRFIFTTSDKAVDPVNVMGRSKRQGEIALSRATESGGQTVYASVRFGNVLGSSGSVVPLVKRQIARGGPVTLTDERMLRFVTTADRAARAILDAARLARGGEIFVVRMPVARVADLCRILIEAGGNGDAIALERVGARSGEKLYEALLSAEEAVRAVRHNGFYVVPRRTGDPAWAGEPVGKAYTALDEAPLARAQLRELLAGAGLLAGN